MTPRLVLSRSSYGQVVDYVPLQTDETVASWANRQSGVHLSSDSEDENAFGQLIIDLPGLSRTLKQQLRRAAQPPDEWLLWSHQRTLLCPRCFAEDWAQGVPAYHRRAWCVAWRTCCPRHGLLFDTENRTATPDWIHLLDRPRWTGYHLLTAHKCSFKSLLNLSLGSDHRAIHLEAALAGKHRGAWFPEGMTQSTLRAIYREIVSDLLNQFYFAGTEPGDQQPHPGFNRALNINRFVINVLAEAILSEWTQTPLPTPALARRTSLLVRAIGWGEANPPCVRAGQLLFRGPTERARPLARYAALLRPRDYARLSQPTAKEHVPYMTLPEARLLGLPHQETVNDLARMTMRGQFLTFDARRGRLVENRFLPVQARLQSDEVPADVVLPAWAVQPPAHMPAEELYVFRNILEPEPYEMQLRSAAIERGRRRKKQKSVRSCLAFRRKDAHVFSEKSGQDPPD